MLTAVVVLAAAVLLAVPLGGVALLRQPPSRQVALYPDVARVRIRLGGGRVELAEDDRADVRIEVVTRRRPGFAVPAAGPPVGGRLDVDGRASQARVVARLPRGTAVRVEVRDGDIAVWGSSGDLELVTATGAISARELSGRRVGARSGTGDVLLHFDGPPDEAGARSETGDVRLVVPEARYAVDVAAAEPGRAAVGIGHEADAPHRLVARSRAGSVTVLPAGQAARL